MLGFLKSNVLLAVMILSVAVYGTVVLSADAEDPADTATSEKLLNDLQAELANLEKLTKLEIDSRDFELVIAKDAAKELQEIEATHDETEQEFDRRYDKIITDHKATSKNNGKTIVCATDECGSAVHAVTADVNSYVEKIRNLENRIINPSQLDEKARRDILEKKHKKIEEIEEKIREIEKEIAYKKLNKDKNIVSNARKAAAGRAEERTACRACCPNLATPEAVRACGACCWSEPSQSCCVERQIVEPRQSTPTLGSKQRSQIEFPPRSQLKKGFSTFSPAPPLPAPGPVKSQKE